MRHKSIFKLPSANIRKPQIWTCFVDVVKPGGNFRIESVVDQEFEILCSLFRLARRV